MPPRKKERAGQAEHFAVPTGEMEERQLSLLFRYRTEGNRNSDAISALQETVQRKTKLNRSECYFYVSYELLCGYCLLPLLFINRSN